MLIISSSRTKAGHLASPDGITDTRPTRRPALGSAVRTSAAATVVAALTLSLLGCATAGEQSQGYSRPAAGPERSASGQEPTTGGPEPSAAGGSEGGGVASDNERRSAPPPPVRTLTGALTAALDPVAEGSRAYFSVGLRDIRSGAVGVYGGGWYDTASIVKVGILAALLLDVQDAGRALTAQERAYATAMIERSDNSAASALWRTIGGADGLDTAHRRLGLTETFGGNAGRWGLTRTTAADQLRLLRAVFEGGSALTQESRAYIRTLMGRTAREQSWGVSAAGDGTGNGFRLKNGWLPRSTTGLWDINSIGQITAGGRDYLIVVLSDGSRRMDTGIALVEAAARRAVGATTAALNGDGGW
ncbi:serine hydrolase [Streptomyces coffeae]|uniref:Serine hydrolase n=1 Tax=Streptomyces coffeae TaxID=621382 RepID=A0ABS1N922_9ACTN|nr:serine hydrolase [Streptomyces coffeae]MBL1096444.1 serine hydrolase [Streptomyces coffeae]